MSGWTKGKWGVESPFGDDELAIVADVDKPTYDWKIVAGCFSERDKDAEYDRTAIPTAEHKANAHLIAAAPDLYEALEELARWVTEDSECTTREQRMSGRSALIAARAVLAKARGET